MIRNRLRDFWFGGEEGVYNEGFDDLFSVPQNYQIPSAPTALKETGNSPFADLQDQPKEEIMETKKGFNLAMLSDIFAKREDEAVEIPQTPVAPTKPALSVVNSSTPMQNEVAVIEPRSFEDSVELVNQLRERKTVIMNLQYLDDPTSQRVIDFISGATYAFEGSQQRVGQGVFVFAPSNYKIETESAGTQAYKDIFAKTFGI